VQAILNEYGVTLTVPPDAVTDTTHLTQFALFSEPGHRVFLPMVVR